MRANYVRCNNASVSSNVTGTQQSDGNNVQTMNQLLQLVGPKGYKRSLLIALSLDTGTEPLKEVLLFISVANLVLHEDKFQFLCRIFDAPSTVFHSVYYCVNLFPSLFPMKPHTEPPCLHPDADMTF